MPVLHGTRGRRRRRVEPALRQRRRILGRVERQRIHPVLRYLDLGLRRHRYRFARSDVKRNEIGHRVEGLVLELELDPFVHGVRLQDDLVDDEVEGVRLGPAGQHVVARLGGAVAHQEAALFAHDLLGTGPGDGAVVPGVGAQVPAVQRQLPFEGLL